MTAPLPGQPRQLAQLSTGCWIYSPLDGCAEPGAWALVTTVRPGPGWTRIYGVDQVTGQRVYVSGRPEREVHACTRDEARAAQLALTTLPSEPA